MLLSLKDDDDDTAAVNDSGMGQTVQGGTVLGSDEESEYSDDDDDVYDINIGASSDVAAALTSTHLHPSHLDAAIQQTVLAFDEHDFFNTTRNTTEPSPHSSALNGHANPTTTSSSLSPKTKQQNLQIVSTSMGTHQLNTHDSSIITISSTTSPSLSNGVGGRTDTNEPNESTTSSNKTASQHCTTSSPSRSGYTALSNHTQSPTYRPNYSSQATAPVRLFSSNILPPHLRQDSINSQDDTDEICLVPDVDFECGISIMDHSGGENRESQPLLGSSGGGGGSHTRDHYEVACNTFMGK